jgi:hypothetical protein
MQDLWFRKISTPNFFLYITKTNKRMRLLNNFRISNNHDRTGKEIVIEDTNYEEVIRIHSIFFSKTYKKQKSTLRLLIWWAIKHYFKILFKK